MFYPDDSQFMYIIVCFGRIVRVVFKNNNSVKKLKLSIGLLSTLSSPPIAVVKSILWRSPTFLVSEVGFRGKNKKVTSVPPSEPDRFLLYVGYEVWDSL